jgi:hypothetical protein
MSPWRRRWAYALQWPGGLCWFKHQFVVGSPIPDRPNGRSQTKNSPWYWESVLSLPFIMLNMIDIGKAHSQETTRIVVMSLMTVILRCGRKVKNHIIIASECNSHQSWCDIMVTCGVKFSGSKIFPHTYLRAGNIREVPSTKGTQVQQQQQSIVTNRERQQKLENIM